MKTGQIDFNAFPVTPAAAPDADYEVANKKYVDDNAGGMTNPMTTAGDIIYGGTSGSPTRLAKGTALQVLMINAGATAPEWGDAASGGKLIVEDNGYGLDNGSTGRGVVGTKSVSLEYSSSGATFGATGDYSHAEGFGNTASGRGSHAEGSSNTASGFQSHAEGNVTTAPGDYSHAEGYGNTASGAASHAEGSYSVASHLCEHSHASGRFSVNGDCQTGRIQSRIETTTTDSTILSLNGTGVTTRFTLADGDGYTCRITFFGKQADGSIGDAVYQVKIKREVATTSLSGTVRSILAWEGDTNLGTPTIAITVDDTNEALQIAVTPANATATRWTASVEYVKINY